MVSITCPTAVGEDGLDVGHTDAHDREWCLRGVDVERRPIGLPELTAVAARRRILRLANTRQREPVRSVSEDTLSEIGRADLRPG